LGKKAERDFEMKNILLELPREQLYQNINQRVDKMMEDGLLAEAQALYPYKYLNALQTVGYKELFDYLDKKISLEKAIEEIKKNTRHFAKRQITWFKHLTPTREIRQPKGL
jgi:tRNA dimethylallyltransferase